MAHITITSSGQLHAGIHTCIVSLLPMKHTLSNKLLSERGFLRSVQLETAILIRVYGHQMNIN